MSNYDPAVTFPTLSYANTFLDWMVATNNLLNQNNDLAANNFYKSTGTVYLQDPTLGLQVSNNAIVGGQLQSAGIGSGASIQNNLSVGGQVYFTNNTTSLYTNGAINSAGEVTITAPGTGLFVANNTIHGGSISVAGTTTLTNTVTVTGNTTVSNNLTVTGVTNLANNVIIGNSANIANSLVVQNNLTVDNNLYVSGGVLNASNTTGVYLSNTVASSIQVTGNFILQGQTVYTSNTIMLAQNTLAQQNGYFSVYRAGGSNASLLWENALQQWQVTDVNTNAAYRILTDEFKSDSLTNSNTSNIATSLAVYNLNQNLIANVNTLQTEITSNVNSLQTQITSNVTSLQSQITSNTVTLQTEITANVNFIAGVDATQNTSITASFLQANAAYLTANSAFLEANAAYATGNTNYTYLTGVEATQNTSITASFIQANAAYTQANAAYATGNTNYTYLTGVEATQNTNISAAFNEAAAAFNVANSASSGVSSLSSALSSTASVQHGSLGIGRAADGSAGDIIASGSIYAAGSVESGYSDNNLKTRLGNIENALDKIKLLTGFYYEANQTALDLGFQPGRQVGISAQDAQVSTPEVVHPISIIPQYLNVDYARLLPYVIEAIKELSIQIEELKGK